MRIRLGGGIQQLRALLEGAGLATTFAPLYGNTPFNNWLVVAERRSG